MKDKHSGVPVEQPQPSTETEEEKESTPQMPPQQSYMPPYSVPTQPPAYTPVVKQEAKGRRVGTITMAFCLIFFGVILLMRVLVPTIDYVFIARLSPAILILLGVEILISNALSKGGKLRYDGVSMFICLLLISGSLVSAIVPEIYYKEQRRVEANQQLVSLLDESSYDLFRNTELISSIEWYVNVGDSSPMLEKSAEISLDKITTQEYIQARVYLAGDFETKEDFAKASFQVVKKITELVPVMDYISFYSNNYNDGLEPIKMFLPLNGRHQINWNIEQMINGIEMQYRVAGGGHISETEANDILRNPENYSEYDWPIAWDKAQESTTENAANAESAPIQENAVEENANSLVSESSSVSGAAA